MSSDGAAWTAACVVTLLEGNDFGIREIGDDEVHGGTDDGSCSLGDDGCCCRGTGAYAGWWSGIWTWIRGTSSSDGAGTGTDGRAAGEVLEYPGFVGGLKP